MLKNEIYGVEPEIQFVDISRKNTDITERLKFEINGDPLPTIKWCRRNFGERHDGWDFQGTTRGYTIEIWSKKLIVMWTLFQE